MTAMYSLLSIGSCLHLILTTVRLTIWTSMHVYHSDTCRIQTIDRMEHHNHNQQIPDSQTWQSRYIILILVFLILVSLLLQFIFICACFSVFNGPWHWWDWLWMVILKRPHTMICSLRLYKYVISWLIVAIPLSRWCLRLCEHQCLLIQMMMLLSWRCTEGKRSGLDRHNFFSFLFDELYIYFIYNWGP